MEVRIGDTVRFISEKTEGVVKGIIDNRTVSVYCEAYGFEIPASVNDLVVIRSGFGASETSGNTEIAAHPPTGETLPSGMLYLAFVPENYEALSESRFDLYLVNDTALTALYSVALYDGKSHEGVSAGHCDAGRVASVGQYSVSELDRIERFCVQAVFYRKGKYDLKAAIDTEIRVNAVALCKAGSYKKTDWLKRVALLRPLGDRPATPGSFPEIDPRQLSQAKREKAIPVQGERPQKQVVGNVVEIDLHAGQLLETMAGMESKDILEYQLDVFRQTLEEYKLRRGQKIVFIHGKGDGVLKQRIRWELQTKYKRLHHQDASFKQYGYGATMVTIK